MGNKVEELRDRVVRYKVGDYVERDIEDRYAVRDICVVGTDDLDSLISAARSEGVAEGAEQERESHAASIKSPVLAPKETDNGKD